MCEIPAINWEIFYYRNYILFQYFNFGSDSQKVNLTAPGHYRPISISSLLTTLFEALIFEKLSWTGNLNPCQFGYRRYTSRKTAFFVANKAFQYYKLGGSNMHSVSLDAAKFFDKLWRVGLFYKLIDYVDPVI